MQKVVEDCGPGSGQNPLLRYVQTFTGDKTGFQDRFIPNNLNGPQIHPNQQQQMAEKQLFQKFNVNEFERFHHPVHPGYAQPQPFMQGLEHLPVGEEGHVHGLLASLNLQNGIENQHQGWLNDYQHAHHQNADLESAWKRPQPRAIMPPPRHDQHEFDQIYRNIDAATRRSNWAEEEERNAAQDELRKRLANQTPGTLLANEFVAQQPQKFADQFLAQQPPSLADEFLNRERTKWGDDFAEGDETEAEWQKRWESIQKNQQAWAEMYLNNDWDEALLEEYEKVYNNQVQNAGPDTYLFQSDNPFLGDSEAFQKGVELFDEGALGTAILAFEAAVQQNPNNTQAWSKLGVAQAENDKDKLAIQALEQAVAIDHGNLPALMALAVSQTNEYNKLEAASALRQWMIENPKYKDLAMRFGEPKQEDDVVKFVTALFLEAARSSPEIDPDVHTALGLFYNLSYEYNRAAECFRAALTVRPDEYALWNKLGATMANDITTRNQTTDMSIDAYFRALEKKPSYTRARSNLGISYMSAHNYVESSKCFLGALSINNSDHLWSSLRTSFQLMHRPDLVQKCSFRDVNLFANDFDF